MSSVRTYFLFVIVVIISLGCANKEQVIDKSTIRVVSTKVEAWFDLMPGPSPGRFHLQGEIKLANSSSSDIENLNLKSVTVYSNKEVVYNFKPYFNPLLEESNLSLEKNSSKEFRFGSERGMKIDSRLDESKLIDVKLNFTFGEESFMYELKDIDIMKVY